MICIIHFVKTVKITIIVQNNNMWKSGYTFLIWIFLDSIIIFIESYIDQLVMYDNCHICICSITWVTDLVLIHFKYPHHMIPLVYLCLKRQSFKDRHAYLYHMIDNTSRNKYMGTQASLYKEMNWWLFLETLWSDDVLVMFL